MGNESSVPGDDDGYRDRCNSADREFDGLILPPMVLVIEAICWRPELVISREGDNSLNQHALKTPPSFQGSARPNAMSSPRIWCTAALDGREMGQPMSFPSVSVGGPLKVTPQSAASVMTLRFSTEAGGQAVISIPLFKLIRYGAPLYTALWLGFPLDAGKGGQCDFRDALAAGQNPEAPKVAFTIFKPSPHQDFHGLAVDRHPDIHGVLSEDMEACTGNTKRSPTAANQIKGLTWALRTLGNTTRALQDSLFSQDGRTGTVKRMQDPILPSFSDPEYTTVSIPENLQEYQVQELFERSRQENMRLQMKIAELEQGAQLQDEHWRKQLESKDTELQALRKTDCLQSAALDEAATELTDLAKLRSELRRQRDDLDHAKIQLEELASLRSQLQSSKGQNTYLQRELTLANEELQRLRDVDERRKTLMQDHNQIQDELARTQASLASSQKELEEARKMVATMPSLEKSMQYLEAEFKLASEKADGLGSENFEMQQELVRSRAMSEQLRIEKEVTTKQLKDQLTRCDVELDALRTRDHESFQNKMARDEDMARLRVENETLRSEYEQIHKEHESDSKRWSEEFEALRETHKQQITLQEELMHKSNELEAMRERQKQYIQEDEAKDARHKMEDDMLQETLGKLRAAAPQRLKDLRNECEALRAKDQERVQLKEELAKALDELKTLRGSGAR